LLKWYHVCYYLESWTGFSALQRAEIAEIAAASGWIFCALCFSALQRAEIAEIELLWYER